jgi:PAS domain S-box-containing protein
MNDLETQTALLDHTQDKIVVVDEAGTYQYVNAAVERVLGYTPEEFVGMSAFECMHPDDRAEMRAAFEQLIEADAETEATVEYRHRAKDGSWVWVESRLSNGSASAFDGYVVTSRDITARKRAERNRRETEQWLEELAAHADDVLWMFSADWSELLFVNDAFEDVWGQSTDAVRAEPLRFLDGVHPDDRPKVETAMELISGGESVEVEYRVNPSKEYRRWVWVQGTPVFEDGEVVRIVGFARDITDHRRRNRQLRVMDNLLRHNLRNDMNVILGHADTSLSGAGPETATSMRKILETGEELLSTASKERQIVDVLVDVDSTTRLDFADIVRETADGMVDAHPDATITIDVPDEAHVVALPKVRSAVRELLENALQHASADAKIHLEVRVHDGTVELQIHDNAPRIPENEIEPLFSDCEPDAVSHGTGLGLWLVYWVVDLSEGMLTFDHAENTGNVVTVMLPRTDD